MVNKITTGLMIEFFILVIINSFKIKGVYSNYNKEKIEYKSNDLNKINTNLFTFDILEQSSFDSLIIPLKRAGNLLLIETVIDGIDGNLIFDSGSSAQLVLNKTYFRNYKSCGTKETSGITGKLEMVNIIVVDSLFFADVSYTKIPADLADLSHIENKKGVKILGFFGLELIKKFEIMIDGFNNKLVLYNRIKKNAKSRTSKENKIHDFCQEIEFINHILFLWAKIGDKKVRFCFDTGAEKNVVCRSLSSKILNTISVTGRSNLSGAGAKKTDVLFGVMKEFSLDNHKIDDMEAIITDLNGLSQVYGVNISGILGYEFMRHGVIYINCDKSQFCMDFHKN